jgi:hypothetical protein
MLRGRCSCNSIVLNARAPIKDMRQSMGRFYGKLEQVFCQFPSTTSKFCQISLNNFGAKIFFTPKSQEDLLHECSYVDGITVVNLPQREISL